jgi:hypothetical protein
MVMIGVEVRNVPRHGVVIGIIGSGTISTTMAPQ